MKKLVTLLFFLTVSLSLSAQQSELNLNTFAKLYFDKMLATQLPNANEEALEQYLALLKDDVGHSHIPWDNDDSRLPDGKEAMRKGMTYYLGVHSEYQAQLLNVFTFNDSAIAIRYRSIAKGVHPQTKQFLEIDRVMMEVLELEDGKVAVIRKYHE